MNSLSKSLPLNRAARRLAGVVGLAAGIGAVAPALSASPLLAGIYVNVDLGAPPPPRHEIVIERNRPGPDYIWISGYWAGSPGHYSWVPGRWERPPHRGSRWVAPHWQRDYQGHYVMVQGGWR